MSHDCRRCDFAGDTHAELIDHATDASHPLCIVCWQSLTTEEPQTCVRCVAAVRRDLLEVADLYALLPAELGHHSGERLPGGRALVALAPGSRGLSQVWAMFAGTDASHGEDEWPGDGDSIAFELSRAEDDWRHALGDPAANIHAEPVGRDQESRVLLEAVSYLSANAGRAAQSHAAFDEFAADLSRLLGWLRSIIREGPQRDVPCTDCNVPLLLEPTEDGTAGVYRCPRCHRRFDEKSYWLAVAETLRKKGATNEPDRAAS